MLVTCPTIATDESLQVPVEHVRRAVGLNELEVEVKRGGGCDDRVELGRFRELKRCAVKTVSEVMQALRIPFLDNSRPMISAQRRISDMASRPLPCVDMRVGR